MNIERYVEPVLVYDVIIGIDALDPNHSKYSATAMSDVENVVLS